MNIQFQYPQFLWALAAIPVFLLFFLGNLLWKRRVAKRIGDPALAKELYKSHSPVKFFLKFFLSVLAFAAGCIALANPRQPDENSAEARKGIDIMVAMDVSNSMLANDIKPDRLSLAKSFLMQLMRKLPDDRIGLVLFAGQAYVQMPLTFDHNAAEMILSSATPSSFRGQGTAIGDALKKADLSFQEDAGRFKTVILVTDGETHDENALEMADELKGRGVMINTVGIGSPGGSTIIDTVSGGTKKDLSGNVVISKLNEQLLQQLAVATNGKYIHLTVTKAAVDELVPHLSQIEKRAFGDTSRFNYISFYMWVVWPMFALLLIEIFLPDRKRVAL